MKTLLAILVACATSFSLYAQTDSMNIDSTENIISDSSAHHNKPDAEMLNDQTQTAPDNKINSEPKSVPAQAPGTEVLTTPTQKAATGSKPAPATAPTNDVKTTQQTTPGTQNKKTRQTQPSREVKPAVAPKQKTTTAPGNKNISPAKKSDKKDMYLVPDSAVKKIK